MSGYHHDFQPGGIIQQQPMTIQIVRRERWWKRPWLRLRRKPTKRVYTIPNAEITGMEIGPNLSVQLSFQAQDKRP